MIESHLSASVENIKNVFVGGCFISPDHDGLFEVDRGNGREAPLQLGEGLLDLIYHEGAISPHINDELSDVLERFVGGLAGRHRDVNLGFDPAHAEGDDKESDEDEQYIHQRNEVVRGALFDVVLGAEFHGMDCDKLANVRPGASRRGLKWSRSAGRSGSGRSSSNAFILRCQQGHDVGGCCFHFTNECADASTIDGENYHRWNSDEEACSCI